PQLQRMKSEDLLATVFPDQVACLENIVGEREVPDHPLVAQTLDDCLHEAMDTEGWLALLRALEAGEVEVAARDLTAPSPFAAEALNARPYAFLDDAPLEERRTQAVQTRGYGDAEQAGDLGRLDPGAIEEVRAQAWPEVRNADEMHEALMGLGCVAAEEALASGWDGWLAQLAKAHRATRIDAAGGAAWWAAERLALADALHPGAARAPAIDPPAEFAQAWTREDALVELVRARLTGLGPVSADTIAAIFAVARGDVDLALLKLEGEGYAMRGRFTPAALAGDGEEWCERHLLARIHRCTVGKLRREIEPVEPRDFMRFLFDWQKVSRAARVSGPDALAGVLAQLEGFEAPAGAWESELLPARVSDYAISWLDDQCTAGRIAWTRLRAAPVDGNGRGAASPVRATPIVLLPRRRLAAWTQLVAGQREDEPALSSRAQKVADALRARGALFFDELAGEARLLQTELEDALAELVARGRATCDSFAGLRALLVPQARRPHAFGRRGRRAALFGIEDAGRWTLTRRDASLPPPLAGGEAARLGATGACAAERTRAAPEGRTGWGGGEPAATAADARADLVEHVARTLLRRYGVVCWRMLEREAPWLPPWRELLRVYHRLEARGEIRGGRFIAGLSGEQFALAEAVAALRQVRRRAHDGELVAVSALDPLNLVGTIVAGDKLPRQPGARVLYRDGLPLATLAAGEVVCLTELPPDEQRQARRLLLREPEPAFARAWAEPAAQP
ncbi:MAG TPA: ATP-dependent DNA helicase, partial [Xanthomonadaceae bacterium]|nr:ATP-dependent DNA helicase [Xanthomonadaceae bacterium]